MAASVKPETLGRRAMSDRDVAARDTVYRKPAPRAARKETTSSTKKSSGGGGGGHKKSSGGGHQRLPQKAPVPTPRPDPNVTLGGTPLDVGDMRGRPDPLMPPPAGPTSMPGFASLPTGNFPARPEFPDRNVMQTPTSAPGFAGPVPPPGPPGGTPLDVGNMRGRPDPMMPPMQTPTGAPGFTPGFPSPTNQPGPEAMGPTATPGAFPAQSPTNQPSDLPVMQTPTGAPGGGAVSLTPRAPGPGRAELAGLLAGGSKKGSPPMDISPGMSLPGEDYLNQLGPDWLRKLFGK